MRTFDGCLWELKLFFLLLPTVESHSASTRDQFEKGNSGLFWFLLLGRHEHFSTICQDRCAIASIADGAAIVVGFRTPVRSTDIFCDSSIQHLVPKKKMAGLDWLVLPTELIIYPFLLNSHHES